MGRSLGTRLFILFMFSVLLAEALMPVKLATTALPPLQRRLLEQLWRPSLKLPDKLLRNGLKNEVWGPRNYDQLVQKLLTNGSTVKVVAFGGSVTVGHQHSNTSYAEQLVEWLRAAFPAADVRLVNLARRATAAAFAALCIVQALPEDADLVLIEYSINGYGGECQCFTSAQTAGYEALLRKVITKAPGASLLAFASFIWLDKDKQPSRYYATGEDQHSMLCKRYGIPMVSARDVLYDFMSNQQQHGFRDAILVDTVHVSDQGAAVYAALLAWALRRQITRSLLHQRSPHMPAAALPLPAAVNPDVAQENLAVFCAEGLGLQRHVRSITSGWKFADEGSNACPGCHKYGYVAHSPNSSIELLVNSDMSAGGNVSSSGGGDSGPPVVLALTFLKSHSGVGRARVECVAGCACEAREFDAKNSRPTSEMHTARMAVGRAKQCLIRVTVQEQSSTGAFKFKLASVAVHQAGDRVFSHAYGPVHE